MHSQQYGKAIPLFVALAAALTALPAGATTLLHPHEFAPVKPAGIWNLAHPGTYVNDNGVTKQYDAVYHVPDNPRGLVYVFHPGGGSAQRYTNNIEVIDILNHLTHAGFAFIATDSALRNDNHDTLAPDLPGKKTAKWDKFPTTDDHTNRDFARLLNMRRRLIDNYHDQGLTTQTPLFAFGMSSGANFAYTFAHMAEQRTHVPDLAAIAAYNGNLDPVTHPVIGDGFLIDTPTFIITGENDNADTRLPNNAKMHQLLLENGTPSIFRVNPEEPLDPDRLNRIPAVARAPGLSDDLFRLFVDGDPTRGLPGFLEPSGERRFGRHRQRQQSHQRLLRQHPTRPSRQHPSGPGPQNPGRHRKPAQGHLGHARHRRPLVPRTNPLLH